MGQELFNAAILGLAVIMLAWHNLWMSSHGAALAKDARSVGNAIRDGRRARSVLLIVVGLAVLREGLRDRAVPLRDRRVGGRRLAADARRRRWSASSRGVAVGWLLYAGLLRIPLRWFFTATGILVLFLAAGMASQAARFLIQADVLPSLATPLWDTLRRGFRRRRSRARCCTA